MFAGIVEESARVIALDKDGHTLVVRSARDHSRTRVGDSIAVDGVCLTVVGLSGSDLRFDLAEETLRCTTLGTLIGGGLVHLERSLQVGDRISGHFVTGHVDGRATLISREKDGPNEKLIWRLLRCLKGFVAKKGSIALAGVSLTVGEVEGDTFSVYIIPHTCEITRLPSIEVGEEVNVEVDLLARYLFSLMSEKFSIATKKEDSKEFLGR